MNDQKKRLLTRDQAALIADISTTYGTEPEDIMFFTADLDPFLGYKTTCVMLNRLLRPLDISSEPFPPVAPDSVAYQWELIWPGEIGRSKAVGVANLGETLDGEPMSDQQLVWLANSRALRLALHNRDIDLMKLHRLARKDDTPLRFTGATKSARATLIAQAHALGEELGLIDGEDKSLWRRLLNKRFKADSTTLLSDPELSDWTAYLKSLTAQPKIEHATA